ncbi:flagellar hook protein FlgE [Psychromonas sp. Urea-02u-13]|uniref:flagellar hook protein FlgE n=1 Tax=Psychromonas sp. Urea-02u-13 TaxID=2058326 RepID=UPI000C32483F|nr:flagellar hook protein FlgE [Psychromonas sp. Urea-02u-13]PKG39530.1 flagellar hook protein FlgE [Psychromonas sp. Urea-02u-13]
MSFNISISGLQATSEQLNSISNNIANVSTSGFKGSRTEFSSVYNGMQAGGVEVAGISQNFDLNGSLQTTGRAMDLGLTGAGFFSTVDSKGQSVYTRSGAFTVNKDNTIVSGQGNKLQGYSVDAKANIQQGKIGDLTISNAQLAASATSKVDFSANFDARATAISTPFDASDATTFTSSYTTETFDSLGNSHTTSQYFVKTADNTWQAHVTVDGNDVTPVPTPIINFNSDGSLNTTTSTVPFTLNTFPLGADPMTVAVDITGSTQYAADFGVSKNNPDGYTSGELAGIRIEDNGMIYAQYSNGQNQLQGQVIIADFPNPNGLVQGSGTSWTQSFASGAPIVGTAGSGVFGSMQAGVLEGSNVDLTTELVDLMTAQRNYQANTKTITATDKMTQTLFNAV